MYAVWFSMFDGDSRERWPAALLSDARVRHYWDESKIIGSWYGEKVTAQEPGHVEWDAFFLYPGEVSWSEDLEPRSWGRTIMATRMELQSSLGDVIRESWPENK